MTVDEIRQRIGEIAKVVKDYELAHYLADQLHHDVLRAVADGHENSKQLAEEALRTTGLRYERAYGKEPMTPHYRKYVAKLLREEWEERKAAEAKAKLSEAE